MRYLFLLLWGAFGGPLSAQPAPSFAVAPGIDYTYRTLGEGRALLENERGVLVPRYGVVYSQPLSDRVFLSVGVNYVSSGYQTELADLRYASEFDPITFEYTPDPALGGLDLRTIDRFLEVPVSARLRLGDAANAFQPYLGIGGAALFYINTYQNVDVTTGSDRAVFISDAGFRSLQFAAILQAGLSYTGMERVHWFVQPTGRFHLTPDAPKDVTTLWDLHRYSVGLVLGGRYQLK